MTFVAVDGSVLLSIYILKAKFGEGEVAMVDFNMERASRV